MTFIRRFLTPPDVATLVEIEAVNILDLEPPASITGVGSGTVLHVGEFENGPFTQYEVSGASDFQTTFGSFGYTYFGVQGNNPCARARKADAAVYWEYWNGNAFVQLANKKFKRLICLRVDTSVGSVSFTRLAMVKGGIGPTFLLSTGQHLDSDPGAGVVTGTFTGVHAIYTSGNGVYPTTFTGGEKMNITVDSGVVGSQIGPVTIFFQASDQTHADVVARINTVLGYTCAAVAALTTVFTGRVKGLAGNITINSGDAAVLAALNIALGATPGTGVCQNIEAVTVAEVNTIMHAASASLTADADENGYLRLFNDVGTSITINVATTATGFGFTIPDASTAAIGAAGVIPAGTRVRDAGAHEWVTMQDVNVIAGTSGATGAGPYTVKVRPALDDTTGVGALALAVNVIPYQPSFAVFKVANSAVLTVALTEAQLDAAYVVAIQSTKALNLAGKQTNIITSARQSNIIRSALKASALEASSEGCYGRMTFIRPPLNSTRATMRAATQPGVGATKDQRVVYSPIGHTTYISQMTALGLAGGAGYAADGIVDVGADTLLASVCAQLPPEENPGQDNTFMTAALGLVSAATNPDVQAMTIVDYTLFRAAGICALIFDNGDSSFQSGVTSVDPLVHPNLRNIARRRMADFLQDTQALRLKSFSKKGNTRGRRIAIMGELRCFLDGLKKAERIDSYSLKQTSTVTELGLGIMRIAEPVRTISSLDAIVLESTVGESVVIEEAA